MKNKIVLLLIILISAMALTAVTIKQHMQEDGSLEIQTIMRLISMDVQTINEGIFTRNFQLIEQGASAINEHPPLSEKSRKLIQETLGDRMQVFGQFDNLVHSRADSIKKAAARQDINQVLEQYQILQQGCVNCHASFQEEIRQARLSPD